jgi:hypothetical protein
MVSVWSPTRLNMYCTSTQGRRGRVELERRLEGQKLTKLGQKYQHGSLYLLSINSNEHLPQSPFEWVKKQYMTIL